jgi:hypothetical protein
MSSTVCKLAKRILEEKATRTYRDIAAQDFPRRADGTQIVKAGTLNRIVKSKGKWLPKNKEILAALGLYKPRLPYPRPAWLYKWYRLPKDERHEVIKEHVEKVKR